MEVGDSPLLQQATRAECGGHVGLWALGGISLRERGLYTRGFEIKMNRCVQCCILLQFFNPNQTGWLQNMMLGDREKNSPP